MSDLRTIAGGLILLAACSSSAVDYPPPPITTWPSSVAIPLAQTGQFYSATVTIGAQPFTLLVDSGSSTVVVAGEACSACAGGKPRYAPGATGHDTGGTTEAEYGDNQEWKGEIYTDLVAIGEGSAATPAIPLAFAAMTSESGFESPSYAGIIGLGPPQALAGDTESYPTVAAESSATMQMSFELCGATGTMWIGDYDASAGSGAPQFTPMIAASHDHPYYNLEIDDLAIGGTSLGLGSAAFHQPLVDTGSTELYIPQAAIAAINTAVNAAPGTAALFPGQQISFENFGCVSQDGVTATQVNAMLPTLSLTLPSAAGPVVVTAPAMAYLDEPAPGMFCPALIDGGDDDSSNVILGQAFLRNFVTVIDVPNQRVGFTPDVGCAANP